MSDPALERFRSELEGELVLPRDAGYEAARRVWNGAIDRRPAAIARCTGRADVARALAFALREKLPVAVRGGAHNVAGNATVDSGLVIDLSRLKAIRVDAAARRAAAEPGVTWAEFDRAAAAFGLATTGGLISTTGIAGFTLGGGIGWLMRAHGLTCDNLLSAEVVTADGRTLQASEAENPDLFWALRGGGGNFGIVTRFEYRLHPVSSVTAGLVLHPAARASEMLRHYREIAATAPDALTMMFGFLTAPPAPFVPQRLQGKPAVAVLVCHTGDPAEGAELVRPIKAMGPPAADAIGVMPYTALQSMLDAGAPAGLLNYWKGAYLDELSDAAIETLVEHGARMGSPLCQLHVHQMGGAVARVAPEATAYSHRRAGFAVNVVGMWGDPSESDRHTGWARATAAALAPFATGGVYVNFLGDEGEQRVRAAYSEGTYARLAELKAKYDPENVFRLNQNIRPRARA
jgi:FAD/FMN-containing dehydrogenase